MIDLPPAWAAWRKREGGVSATLPGYLTATLKVRLADADRVGNPAARMGGLTQGES